MTLLLFCVPDAGDSDATVRLPLVVALPVATPVPVVVFVLTLRPLTVPDVVFVPAPPIATARLLSTILLGP